MKNIFAAALLAAAAVFAFAVPATAGIVSVSAAGPGGTASPLNIVTIFNTNDAVIYGADFTADAPIYITITLSAGGSNTQFFLAPGGNLLTNNSGVTFSNFYMDLLGYPPGTTLNGGGTAETHSHSRPSMPTRLRRFSLVCPGCPAGLDFPTDSQLN